MATAPALPFSDVFFLSGVISLEVVPIRRNQIVDFHR